MVREIAFFAGVALLLAALWFIKHEVISKRAKAVITAFVLVCGICAWLYESAVFESQERVNELLQEFRQGRTLECAGVSVTSEKFNYEFGTACFVAKRGIKEIEGMIIPIKGCQKAQDGKNTDER